MSLTTKLTIVFASLACSIVLAFLLVFVMHRSSNKVVHQWKQPESIDYKSFGPYYLSVVEDDLDWRGFPIHVPRSYFIYAGSDSGEPTYGHRIDFSFYPDATTGEELKSFLKKAQVTWTADGVELVLPTKHRLFIPKDSFVGGR